jgi:hypothetical protein
MVGWQAIQAFLTARHSVFGIFQLSVPPNIFYTSTPDAQRYQVFALGKLLIFKPILIALP